MIVVYRTIKTTDDAVSLQNNLDTLQQWEKDWLMSFNPDTCEVMGLKGVLFNVRVKCVKDYTLFYCR
jgi:hypothetical protein